MGMLMSYEEITKKFKVGDKVRLVNGVGMAAKVGATAVVVGYELAFNDSLYYVNIKWDRNELSGSQGDGGYFGDDVEVIGIMGVSTVGGCPRCQGEMYEKQTEQYGIVKKCRKCGYC